MKTKINSAARKAYLSITICLLACIGYAQDSLLIRGKITSETGAAIPAVSIKLKGTARTTISGNKGDFSIRMALNATLIFEHVGYQTQEYVVKQNKPLDIKLSPQNGSLNDVIVIGYGQVKKKDLTGSVGEVKVQELAKAPVASIEQSLAGRVAGVQVRSNDGQPGEEGISIQIRGTGSLTQSTSPLYVIDGFPIEDFQLSSLNPEDIESINILKDASATAIYGSRGGNGVIVIETKKGKIGKPVINYSGSMGFQEVTKRMDLLSPYEFVKLENERDPVSAAAVYFTDGKTLESYRNQKGINWQDQFFTKGTTSIHNLAVRGGNKETRYSVSGSLFGTDAVVENTGFNKKQFRFSLDQTLSNRAKAGIVANYNNQESYGQYSAAIEDGLASSATLYSVWGYRPITGSMASGIDDDLQEDLFDSDVNDVNDFRINPIISAKNTYRKRKLDNITANAYLSYNITKDLVFRTTGGVNLTNTDNGIFYNSLTRNGSSLRPSNAYGQWGSIDQARKSVWTNENTLTYTKNFNKTHQLIILGGLSFQKFRNSGNGFTAIKVPDESLGIKGLGKGTAQGVSSFATLNTLQSFFARANYNIGSKYLFTATWRADGSSKFASGNKWAYFPSAAFAWRMKEESFMKNWTLVNDAKLRLSYGTSGNNRVNDFAHLSPITQNNSIGYSYGNELPTTAAIPGAGNAELKWETSAQFNIGYDISMFNNRMELTVDLYRKNTNDLLLNANMPPSTGYTRALKNIGKLRNEGLELTLNTINVKTKTFEWNSSFNISFNRNEIKQLADGEQRLMTPIAPRWQTGFADPVLYIAQVGQQAAQFVGYIFDGVYQYSDFDQLPNGSYVLKGSVPANGNTRANIKPGDIKYRDLNNDGVADAHDQTIIGRGLPKHIGGFSNNLLYKGFALNIFFQWSVGNDIYNANRQIFEGSLSVRLNQFASYANRWTPENPTNAIPRVGGENAGSRYNSRMIESGSFLRLKTLALDYNVPAKKLLRQLKIANIALSMAIQNLVTWTNYSGMDPEVSTRNSPITPGFDYSAYPNARTLVFGLKATL